MSTGGIAPKYREDAKGNVRELVADFRMMCSNVIAGADHFIVSLDGMPEHCLAEYRDILTRAEMERAFKAALRAA